MTRRVAAGLAGAAALIAAVTVASRVVGFLRSLVLAGTVGPTALGTAYTSANVVPNVLFEIAAGGALAGAVVPLLAAPLRRGSRAEVDQVTSALLGWTLAVLVPLAVVMAVLAGPAAALLVPGADPATVAVTAGFLRVFAVQIPLYGIGVVLFGVLQAHRRFAWPALAPLLNNLVVIGVLAVFGALVPDATGDPAGIAPIGLRVLAWGTTAGVAVMTLAMVGPAWRTGLRVRPTLRFGADVGPRARTLLLAGLGAVVAQQLTVVVTVLVSNRWGGDGTFPIWLFLQQVYLLPYAVLAYPLITAAFPQLAERAANDDTAGFGRLAASTTRALAVVSVAGSAALVAGAPGVEEVYATIANGPVAGVGSGLAWLAPGLVGFVLAFHLSRVLYALHRGRSAGIALGAGWIAVGVLAAAAAALIVDAPDQAATLQVLGGATSAGMSIGGLVALLAVRRATGRSATQGLGRTMTVAVLAGGVGAVAGRLVADLVLAGGTGTGVGVLAAGGGAVVALVVLAAGVALGDRSVLAALRARPEAPDPADPPRGPDTPGHHAGGDGAGPDVR